jgi:hypothetical protein
MFQVGIKAVPLLSFCAMVWDRVGTGQLHLVC